MFRGWPKFDVSGLVITNASWTFQHFFSIHDNAQNFRLMGNGGHSRAFACFISTHDLLRGNDFDGIVAYFSLPDPIMDYNKSRGEWQKKIVDFFRCYPRHCSVGARKYFAFFAIFIIIQVAAKQGLNIIEKEIIVHSAFVVNIRRGSGNQPVDN
jgi:hypothetical protein